MTVAPTMIAASQKRNVIPALCEVTIDCRLLPAQTPEEAEATIRTWLGDAEYERENDERLGGPRPRPRGPPWDARGAFVARDGRGTPPAPSCGPGFPAP